MRVKFIGKGCLIAEYNGVKYYFDLKNTEKDIPIEVYDYIKSTNHMNGKDLRPDIEGYVDEIKRLKATTPADLKYNETAQEENKVLIKHVAELQQVMIDLKKQINTLKGEDNKLVELLDKKTQEIDQLKAKLDTAGKEIKRQAEEIDKLKDAAKPKRGKHGKR